MLRGSCGPRTCPAPPTVSPSAPDPYKPGWLAKLSETFAGRAIIAIGDYLYLLKSKCSGYLHYDANTDQISVQNPPFVSAIPKETRFGFVAKVVPTRTLICDDASESCGSEVRQELAAQILEAASCGDLVVTRPPDCGELPVDESADADKQARFDVLTPKELGASECPGEVRFLMKRDGKRGKVDANCWLWMRRLRMAQSQWGPLLAGNTAIPSVQLIGLIPVVGGDEDDPCFEMRMIDPTLVPSNAGGLTFHPITKSNVFTGVNGACALTFFPTAAPGLIYAHFNIKVTLTNSVVGKHQTLDMKINGANAHWAETTNVNLVINRGMNVMIPVTTASPLVANTLTNTGGATFTQLCEIDLIGYSY